MTRPLAIDLCCGLGGWTEGLLLEGYDVVGFDIERHQYGEHKYPAQLVLQDITTLHGAQFRDAALIVASSPCQAYSYRAMPWSRAKALPPPDNSLFETCFRLQHEAIAAAGRHIPLVVENVRGAQPWVGRSRWNYGSFHLWGDVPALMPIAAAIKKPGHDWSRFAKTGERSPQWNEGSGNKLGGGANVPGIGWTGFADTGASWRNREHAALKGGGGSWFNENHQSFMRQHSSKSPQRKRASALIAKIPLPLSRHIAATYKEPAR